MNDFLVKKYLWEECIKLQDTIIKNAKIAMKEAQNSANEYGLPKDRYDSYRTQLLRKRDLYAEQYEKALKERKALELINPENRKDCIEFGALVITNNQKMFISIGLGKVVLNDNIFYAISPMVPLFKVISGLKKGDIFEFNENSFKVLEVF